MEDLWKAVPAFPHFKELTLEDKPLLDTLFTHSPPVISEFTFTNLFIWRYAYQIKISRLQDSLCLLADRGEASFFFPIIGQGDVIKYYHVLLRTLEKMNFSKGLPMSRWKYHITLHKIPQPQCEGKTIVECDQAGQCFVHDACQGELEWLEDLFGEKGNDGWELVQSAYHHRELLCIWKKKTEG